MRLPILTLVLGVVIGHSLMSYRANSKIDYLENRAIMLAKMTYIRGCVEQGGNLETCRDRPNLNDFESIMNDPLFNEVMKQMMEE